MHIRFKKMQALGNDFAIVEAGQGDPPDPDVIRQLANRRTGIGFDQLLWLAEPSGQDIHVVYRVFNSDGGEVEQCGNGARCIARLVADEKNLGAGPVHLQSQAGPMEARVNSDGSVSVDMGVPVLSSAKVPFSGPGDGPCHTLDGPSGPVEVTLVSMGNPHCVIRVDDVKAAPVEEFGPFFEHHEYFPNRANIGFMQVMGPRRIGLRVHERGVGETRACGSGACAAVVAGRLNGSLDSEVSVELPGGSLTVRWDSEASPVWLTGEAIKVFEGAVNT